MFAEKVNVGIIGTGNIGIDLLYKIKKSKLLQCTIFAGRHVDSKGIGIARELNIPTSIDSIEYFIKHPDCCDIVFDATSASAHKINAPILKKLNKFTLDLTPAKVGEFCIPVLNGDKVLDKLNVNMITCGGQAAVPILYAINEASTKVNYFEIVASIASLSAGIGTRNNIDEFTQTTKDAISFFTGVENSKAIIILNSANPPVKMRNTVYALIDNPDINAITKKVKEIEKKIQKYVPGYKVITGPVIENGRVTVILEVTGVGDYLPAYAGNLDIITCAAVEIAERYASRKFKNE